MLKAVERKLAMEVALPLEDEVGVSGEVEDWAEVEVEVDDEVDEDVTCATVEVRRMVEEVVTVDMGLIEEEESVVVSIEILLVLVENVEVVAEEAVVLDEKVVASV